MAVVTSDAVQMPPPRAASPGLPPVDPVTQPAAFDEARGLRMLAAARPAEESGGVRTNEDSMQVRSAEPGEDGGQRQRSVISGQGKEPNVLAQIVAVREGSEPSGNPSLAAFLIDAEKSISSGERLDEAAGPVVVPDPDQPGLFDILSEACGHSRETGSKDQQTDPCHPGSESVSGVIATACGQAEPQSLGVDRTAGSSLSVADEPARRSTRVPPRIADRPRLEEWTDDELLTLPEAAALFWPAGPITTNTLRTAGRDGSLAITKVAGKFFTTPMAVRRMGLYEAAAVRPGVAEAVETSPEAAFQMKLAEAKALGRERARPRRAAKRSVAPAVSSRVGQ